MLTEPQITEKFDVRFPQDDDADLIADLVNRCSIAIVGTPGTTATRLRTNWSFEGVDREKDFCVIWDGDKPVAYAELWNDDPPYVSAWLNAQVDPHYEGQGMGTYLTHWGERRARETFKKAPADAKLIFSCGAYANHASAIELFENEQFAKTRTFWTMKIELDQDIPEPQFPPNITITNYAEHRDLPALALATDDAFKDHWGYVDTTEERRLENWQAWTDPEKNPKHDPTTFWIALDGDEIVAMSLCTPNSVDNENWGYVSTLGVRRPWRRQGLALNLLYYTFHEMKKRGKESVYLGVDAQSLTGATRLYEKAGMYVFRESSDYEKVIRDGTEYRTLSVEE